MRHAFLLTILFITGCRKQDNFAPKVVIHTPDYLQTYSYGEFIEVRATIEDDRVIESVQVGVLYGGEIPKLKSITKFPGTNKYELSAAILFDDIHLYSGRYYVKVTAYDGKNHKSEYVEIRINEEPKRLEGILFVDKPSANYELNLLDSAGSSQSIFSIGSEFLNLATCSYIGQVAICGTKTEPYRILDATDWTVEWQEQPGQNPPYDYYSGLAPGSTMFYSGTTTGLKHVRLKDGALHMVANEFGPGYQSQEGFYSHGSQFVDEFHPSGGIHYLVSYRLATGVATEQYLLNFDLKLAIEHAYHDFILFGDQAGNAYMTIFNESDGSFYSPHALNGSFMAATSIGNQKYLIALSTGLYSYNYSTNSLILLNTYVPESMVYEPLSNTVFAIDASSLRQLKTDGTTLNTYPVNNGKTVQVLYNK